MPENHLFEYAVIRIVPRVEREEFLNAGVILFCKTKQFLETSITLNEGRLLTLFPGLNVQELRFHLDAFENISHGKPDSGPIAKLDAASRFRWLTAKRSTILQTSPVHPGLCMDPALTIRKLSDQLVSSNPGDPS